MLMTVIRNGHLDVVACLINDLGADFSHTDQSGWTALMFARNAGLDTIAGLLQAGNAAVGMASSVPAEDVDNAAGFLKAAKAAVGVAASKIKAQVLDVAITVAQEREEKMALVESLAQEKENNRSLRMTLTHERRESAEAKSNAAELHGLLIEEAAKDKRELEVQMSNEKQAQVTEMQAQVTEVQDQVHEAEEGIREQAAKTQTTEQCVQTGRTFTEMMQKVKAQQRMEQEAIQGRSERTCLKQELTAARVLAEVPIVERVSGLPDAKLRALEVAARAESTQREVQRAVEQEREAMREARLCEMCLDRPKIVASSCGHKACANCAQGLANCHICRQIITARMRLYF
jgi:hypothetical protein